MGSVILRQFGMNVKKILGFIGPLSLHLFLSAKLFWDLAKNP